jgi:hypothetical protein
LTLYVISKDKEVAEDQKQTELLKDQVNNLSKQFEKLKSAVKNNDGKTRAN